MYLGYVSSVDLINPFKNYPQIGLKGRKVSYIVMLRCSDLLENDVDLVLTKQPYMPSFIFIPKQQFLPAPFLSSKNSIGTV